MPAYPKRIPLEEHQAHGADLKAVHSTLQKLGIKLGPVYGKTSKASRLAWKAVEAVGKLKNEMDNLVCGENQKAEDHIVTGCYYGPA